MTHPHDASKAEPIKGALARIPRRDIPDNGAMSIQVHLSTGLENVILTRRGEFVSAFINRCPHARWPLDLFDGRFLFTPEGALMCAAHAALFDPLSGRCLGGPGQGQSLTPITFRIEDDCVIFPAIQKEPPSLINEA